MFLFSIKLSPKRVGIVAVALVLAAGLFVAGTRAFFSGDPMASPVNEVAGQQENSEPVKPQKVVAKTNEERVAYIQSFGWEVTAEPAEVQEVVIPEEFDAVYLDYNNMQKTQGFNLEKYAGERCKRYSYVVTNYPDCTDEVRCNLLISGDRIIGGDVCSTMQDGFIHGFSPKQ